MLSYYEEKPGWNVPYEYGKVEFAWVWPPSVPWAEPGGGVLFGFCYGNRLKDANSYLAHGTNKAVFYKIFHAPDEIDYDAIVSLLKEVSELDSQFK